MRVVPSQLFRLTAADLMSREVLTLSQWMPVQSAIRALTRVRVGGAPVVDEQGRCVGVFSLSDCNRRLRGDNRDAQGAPPLRGDNRDAQGAPPLPGCVCCDWTIVREEWDTLPADAVSRYMTPDPVLVLPETPVGEVAQMMVEAHIHRLIVVGEDRRPLGVVSSTDVLAAVARAARECEYEEAHQDLC
jgi:CBS domain-containing protein